MTDRPKISKNSEDLSYNQITPLEKLGIYNRDTNRDAYFKKLEETNKPKPMKKIIDTRGDRKVDEEKQKIRSLDTIVREAKVTIAIKNSIVNSVVKSNIKNKLVEGLKVRGFTKDLDKIIE